MCSFQAWFLFIKACLFSFKRLVCRAVGSGRARPHAHGGPGFISSSMWRLSSVTNKKLYLLGGVWRKKARFEELSSWRKTYILRVRTAEAVRWVECSLLRRFVCVIEAYPASRILPRPPWAWEGAITLRSFYHSAPPRWDIGQAQARWLQWSTRGRSPESPPWGWSIPFAINLQLSTVYTDSEPSRFFNLISQ